MLKPPGMTSFDAVSWIKKTVNAGKAGHTGTLDPRASGVLPVCLNKATKIIPFLPEDKKEYKCEIELGLETTTHDREGEITERSENWKNLSLGDIETVLENFSGRIEQVPPMYSAVKKNGKKLYEFAREGKEVEREAREVSVECLTVTSLELPLVHLNITCSSGTYIRALARDLGRNLECGGVLNFLIRTASGPFKIEDALIPGELNSESKIAAKLLPITAPLDFPELEVKTSSLETAINGAKLTLSDFNNPELVKYGGKAEKREERYIVRGPDNMFVSVSRLSHGEDKIYIKPERVFNLEE